MFPSFPTCIRKACFSRAASYKHQGEVLSENPVAAFESALLPLFVVVQVFVEEAWNISISPTCFQGNRGYRGYLSHGRETSWISAVSNQYHRHR